MIVRQLSRVHCHSSRAVRSSSAFTFCCSHLRCPGRAGRRMRARSAPSFSPYHQLYAFRVFNSPVSWQLCQSRTRCTAVRRLTYAGGGRYSLTTSGFVLRKRTTRLPLGEQPSSRFNADTTLFRLLRHDAEARVYSHVVGLRPISATFSFVHLVVSSYFEIGDPYLGYAVAMIQMLFSLLASLLSITALHSPMPRGTSCHLRHRTFCFPGLSTLAADYPRSLVGMHTHLQTP